MTKLLIDLETLPEEGKDIAGELDAAIFDLRAQDPKPLGPLRYRLHARRYDNELLLQGSLSCPFEFECVRTLHAFTKTLALNEAAIAVEVDGQGEVDATEQVREELLLEMPNHATCDIADEEQSCEIDPLYLAVDKEGEDELNPAPPEEGDSRWSALDAFRSEKS